MNLSVQRNKHGRFIVRNADAWTTAIMTLLLAWCLVAALAYGLTVGCSHGTHRADRIAETNVRTRTGPAVRVDFICRCGRVPLHWLERA